MERVKNVDDIYKISKDKELRLDFILLFNDKKEKGKRGYYLRLIPSKLSEEGKVIKRYSNMTRDVNILEADYQSDTKLKEAIMIRDSYVKYNKEFVDELIENIQIYIEAEEEDKKSMESRNNRREARQNRKNDDIEFKSVEKIDITFDKIAGLKEVKEELYEIVDSISDKEKYKKMGAKLPKGILLYGPPGTGKTLIAKGIAGETKSNFYSVSGSEFTEKYVGVGAKRVRKLFEKAKKNAPSIIFIDEIDAIGARRSPDSNAERDQTLNQLLVEMDGFSQSEDIVVIGATNRIELLDEALKRAGRLSKHIYIGNPDLKSRKELFEIHTKDKPLNEDVDLEDLAKKTHGFSGADIENIANESALLAVRQKREDISQKNLEDALEKVIGGLASKSKKLREQEKQLVSYHEAGHALVGTILGINKVQKISIVPHGQALGFVINLPEEDKYLSTKKDLENEIKMLLAGRVAEEVQFGYYSTGASNDLLKATKIATKMVCNYGMDEGIGLFTREISSMDKLTPAEKDSINAVLNDAYRETTKLLEINKHKLDKLANYLYENEEMDSEDIEKLFKDDIMDMFA